MGSKKYLADISNYLDNCVLLAIVVAIFSDLIYVILSPEWFSINLLKVFIGISLFFSWFKLLSYTKGIQRMGFLLRLLV